MLPPRPIGNRQVDLNEAGQNISNAQHGRPTTLKPVVDKETGKIRYVSSSSAGNDPAGAIQGQKVF